jgi:hypothetical protein
MNLPRNSIATKACLLLATLIASPLAFAEPIGVVSDSTGPLLGKTASGSIKVLAVGSPVELEETLVSRAGAYARVTLTDHTAVALGPDTELTIEKYSFHEKAAQVAEAVQAGSAPHADEAVLALSKGRVRVTSGTLGSRETDTFILEAGAATIDIRHSTFIAEYVQRTRGELALRDAFLSPGPTMRVIGPAHTSGAYTYAQLRSFDTQAGRPLELSDSASLSPTAPIRLAQNTVAPNAAGMNPGLYVQVLDGTIHVTNGGGTQNFTAGQFGYTPSFQQPPVILPTNPGMQFTPPPSFSSTTGTAGGTGASKPGDVDCQVR